MIELIAHTVTSERDRNGNCYHFCQFVFPALGRHDTLLVDNMGGDGGNGLPMQLLDDWEKCYIVNEVIPKRRWQQMFKDGENCHAMDALPKLREMLERARGKAVQS